MKLTLSPIKNSDLISKLAALALFLAIIEHIIPKPIPFIRIGLANLPILLSLKILKPKEIIILVIIKSLGSSIITGTLFSWISIYSFAGSIVSGSVMIIFYYILKNRVSLVGISVLGAISNNTIQIYIATLLLGSGAIYIGIPILITGLITGTLLGLIANKFMDKSVWIRSYLSKN